MRFLLATTIPVALAACATGRTATETERRPAPPPPSAQRIPDTQTTVLASRATLLDRRPLDADADTLLAEYETTSRGKRRYEVPALAGTITCFGGPALDGTVPAELYVRRAINRAGIVEDIVTIYPDDLLPRRRMLTMGRGPGVSNLTGRAGELRGRALIADTSAERTVQALEDSDGAILFVAQQIGPESLRIVAHAIDPDAATRAGIVLDALATPDAWAAAQNDVLELASRNSLLIVKGELPTIEGERCQQIFGHFPPP